MTGAFDNLTEIAGAYGRSEFSLGKSQIDDGVH